MEKNLTMDFYEVKIGNRNDKVSIAYYDFNSKILCSFINDMNSDFINTYGCTGFIIDNSNGCVAFETYGSLKEEQALDIWNQIEMELVPISSISIKI